MDRLAPAGARLKTATNASFPPPEYEWWRSCYERPLSASFWIRLCLMSPLPLCEKNLSMNFCTRTKRSFYYTISSRRRPALDWCWLRYLHLSTSAGIQKVRVWEHAHLPKHSVLENHSSKSVLKTDGRLLLRAFPPRLSDVCLFLVSVLRRWRLYTKEKFIDESICLKSCPAHRNSVGVSKTEELWPIKTVWRVVLLGPTLERKFWKFTRHSLRGNDFTGVFYLNNILWPFVILLFTRDA